MTAAALHARWTPGHEQRLIEAVVTLREAAAAHAGRIVQASSLGVEDMVVTDLIARHRFDIAVATLATGKLHDETLALVPRIESRYGIAVELYEPQPVAVLQFVAGDAPTRQCTAVVCCWAPLLSHRVSVNRAEGSINKADV